tara:strand:- start:1741 stop:3390 length:1650 start_codon:yes stop_codon:yes gene_type:complete
MSNNITKNQKSNILDILDNSKISRIIFLIILGISGIVFRLVFFPYDVPLFDDSQGYFWYAIDASLLNNIFPEGHNLTNNGWPIFVSIFFQFIDSNNFLDYQNIQRLIGVVFSVATIFPVYLLCTKFVKKGYSLLGTTLFICEPRLIQNSSLGTPESMYVFLIASILALFLSTDFKKIYLAFFIVGLLSLVRYEGILIIIPLSVIFFLRFRFKKKDLLKYFICITVFCLVIIPVGYLKNETTGQDGFVSHISAGPEFYQKSIEQNSSSSTEFLEKGITNMIKFLGWVQIPSFLIFVPLGIILFFKKMDYKKTLIILTSIMILIPAFYAYSRDFSETKYLYALFPIFSLIACFTFKKIFDSYDKKKLIMCLILIGIILSSSIFISWKMPDNEHYRETYQIIKQISDKQITINSDFGTHGGEFLYFHWTRLNNVNDFPILKDDLPVSNISYNKQIVIENGMRIHNLQYDDKSNITNLKDYLKLLEKQNVTHLFVDKINISRLINNDLRNELQQVFYNENNYPFLIKEYDSKENGFKYHVKLFKIKYENIEGI